MRSVRTRIPGSQSLKSSFLSCEKDTEEIIEKLFVEDKELGNELKRLMIINTPDCLYDRTNPEYNKKIKETSVKDLRDKGYIRLEPKIEFGEHEEIKSYLMITFDNFTPNANNPYYRDCTVMIDVVCDPMCWDVGNYRLRPFQIAGYIDAALNGARLSGIGTLNFLGCNQIVLSENLSGYCLIYSAIHGVDDVLPVEEDAE